ncbi:hypothetical protein RN001_014509 [Aquatica leii]|uniref:Protein Skeletor n=1 Tax=Aquatica leii TaxID=1421715 RepID=A0AAN7PYK6_9COLE|nr:hypothetical protein RN001_014509 [Aquatica leii]
MSGRGNNILPLIIVCFTPVVFTQTQSPLPVVPLAVNEENVTNSERTTVSEVTLLPFMQLAHGLSSDAITIIGNNAFFIENFHYDGKGPDAHFWVGTGSWPSDNGTLVHDQNDTVAPLHAYHGQNLTITLPNGLTVNDIDYLSVWCIKFKHNFGHTYTKKKMPGQSLGVQLEPFQELAHGLRSDPIVVLDQKTFYVPNLHYDGKGPDAHFWVGKGDGPSPTGILVPDENGSSRSISAYFGNSIYVTLPHNVTVDDIDYFGVWCIQHKQNFGHTLIPKNVTMPKINGNSRYNANGEEIIRVKKCCPVDEVLLSTGCGLSPQKFNLSINVYRHNATHIDDNPLESIDFVPFVQAITCEHQKYPLDPIEDEFPLLKNGSLMVLNTQEMLSMDQYCFESVNFLGEKNKDNWVTTAILCFSGATAPLSDTFFIFYAVGILLSAMFLILTALVFLIIREVRDTRGKCVIFYSVSMAVAFVCLVTAQFSELDQTSCTVIAYVIQMFLVSSFTWLTLISCETLCKILLYDKDAYTQDRKRLFVYIGVGVLVPALTSLISLLIDRIPDIPTSVLKPQFGRNSCWFDQNKTTSMYFYVPIGIAIICNVGLGIAMKCKLLQFQKNRRQEIAWLTIQEELKPMFRSCVILLTLMSVCWIMEMISFVMNSNEGVWRAIDIINSLQGVLVFIIFVAHRPVKNKLCKWRRKVVNNDLAMEEREPALMNSNGTNQDFLTVLHRADSTELY